MRLIESYKKEILKKLKENLGETNYMAVPRLVKVTLNVGVGRYTKDQNYVKKVEADITSITGQKAILTKAKKSISAFKVKEGQIVGIKVTLRGKRMFDFLEKLINITLPRVRDFRGLNKNFIDRTGNLSLGFREHLAFPEITADEVDSVHGLEVNINTTAKTHDRGLALFKLLGFPFRETEEVEKTKKVKIKKDKVKVKI